MSQTDRDLLKKDMIRLRRMLDKVVRQDADFEAHLKGQPDLQMLDLACGACNEAETLADFFVKLKDPDGAGTPASFTGLDLRAREIADAKQRFQDREGVEFAFMDGDATKLDSHKELPGEFDVIFIRHQNLWNGKRTWEEIYHKALEKLSPQGRLIITSYFDREHEQALDAFKGQGGELIVTESNPDSRALITPGKSIDRHVAMLKRKE